MDPKHLKYIAAPMVRQSDLPFRLLVETYGATSTYTQMMLPERLLNDQEYLEHHLRDLTTFSSMKHESKTPVVVQLCGNDAEKVVAAAKKVQGYCDAIDLNLGCPQEAARDGRYGAYLLGLRDWPLVESIVEAMDSSLNVPVSAKLRLCQPKSKTIELAQRLEAKGASWITLHPRTVSARRRRQGPADLSVVKELKDHLRVPVVSNGNVRTFADLQTNLEYTKADGLMVGETLLDNPCLFSNITPDPFQISLEYLALCEEYPDTATLHAIQAHVLHFVGSQCNRQPWFTNFRAAVSAATSLQAVKDIVMQRRALSDDAESHLSLPTPSM